MPGGLFWSVNHKPLSDSYTNCSKHVIFMTPVCLFEFRHDSKQLLCGSDLPFIHNIIVIAASFHISEYSEI